MVIDHMKSAENALKEARYAMKEARHARPNGYGKEVDYWLKIAEIHAILANAQRNH